MASSEPANTCSRHQPTQKQKDHPHASVESCKLSVAGRVQFPYSVQDCSPPKQRSSSKGSHGGAEKQENAKRNDARRPFPTNGLVYLAGSQVRHRLTINPRVKCHFFPTSESDLSD